MYVDRIREFLLPLICSYKIYNYQSIYIDNFQQILSRRERIDKGKLPLFRGNGEWLILLYDQNSHDSILQGAPMNAEFHICESVYVVLTS